MNLPSGTVTFLFSSDAKWLLNLRATLGAAAYNAARAEGHSLSLEAAIDYALDSAKA